MYSRLCYGTEWLKAVTKKRLVKAGIHKPQAPGRHGDLNFAWWRLLFVAPQYEIVTYHPHSCWSFEVDPIFFYNLCTLFKTRTLNLNETHETVHGKTYNSVTGLVQSRPTNQLQKLKIEMAH
jgi:hypothetical protein